MDRSKRSLYAERVALVMFFAIGIIGMAQTIAYLLPPYLWGNASLWIIITISALLGWYCLDPNQRDGCLSRLLFLALLGLPATLARGFLSPEIWVAIKPYLVAYYADFVWGAFWHGVYNLVARHKRTSWRRE